MPNWLALIVNDPARLRKTLLVMAVFAVLFMGIKAFSGAPEVASNEKPEGPETQLGNLASRDAVITQRSEDNEKAVFQLTDQFAKLNQIIEVQRRQIDLLTKKKSPKQLTEAQMRDIARREISQRQRQAPVVEPQPPARWQHVRPEKMPQRVKAEKPTPKWVTIPAGSTARAVLDDGLAWIADDTGRFHNIRIADIRTPNDRIIPLGECHVMMRSELRIPTEVVARLPLTGDVLSCVLPNNEPLQVEFKGYAQTGDNVQGVVAKVYSNDWDILKEFGKAIPFVTLARVIDGARRVSTTALGNVTQEGGSAVSEIGTEIARFYIENARVYARKVFWVPPKQDIYVTFRREVQLPNVTAKLLAKSRTFNRKALN